MKILQNCYPSENLHWNFTKNSVIFHQNNSKISAKDLVEIQWNITEIIPKFHQNPTIISSNPNIISPKFHWKIWSNFTKFAPKFHQISVKILVKIQQDFIEISLKDLVKIHQDFSEIYHNITEISVKFHQNIIKIFGLNSPRFQYAAKGVRIL